MAGIAVVPALLAVAALLVAGCDLVSGVPARRLECDPDTARPLCEAVARAAISAVNREAVGPIDVVTEESVDCLRWAQSNFGVREYGSAARCWQVNVLGSKSRGWSTVYQLVLDGPVRVAQP